MSVLGFIARAVLWSVLLLMILENLGFNIFSSLSIAMDKPFVIGDFIIVDEHLGTIEYIGLKTTRIHSFSGEQIVFSNSDLLESRIRNFKRMYERRVVFGFGVTYETPLAKLERIPLKVREIVTSQPKARFDHAHFKEFDDSSRNFEVIYFVQDPDYNLYMDIQQAINLALIQHCEQERIDFAYPTRTLHLHHETCEVHG